VKSKSSTQVQTTLKAPKLYKVLMHNDDVTPMDFVVSLLMVIFKHPENKAYALMLKIHTDGLAICGLYTQEIAQTRMLQAQALTQTNGWPLKVTIEEQI
jgi:ATP-dependent Clp protease adaptor protein ClpS